MNLRTSRGIQPGVAAGQAESHRLAADIGHQRHVLRPLGHPLNCFAFSGSYDAGIANRGYRSNNPVIEWQRCQGS
jgi:hypothetical protein